MKRFLITAISTWAVLNSFFIYAQGGKASLGYAETIDLHVNTDFLITGETLYYSIHCLEFETNRSSMLSKLAYVELIGENEKPFLQAKVLLTEGRGAGDFFLPSALPSGNYTLIAYTKWMRNFPLNNFFQKRITIINPYLKPLANEVKSNSGKAAVSDHFANQKIEMNTSQVQLTSDSRKYSPRQKVTVVIKNNDLVHDCKISLNVHRYYKAVGAIVTTSKQDSVNNVKAYSAQPKSPIGVEHVTYFPDFRGETIGGIVREKSSHVPVANTAIYLSATDSAKVFQISGTDSTGRFYFSAKNIRAQNGIRFQVDRGSESAPVEVILDEEFVNDYQKFKPLPFSISASIKDQIEQRNVYSQIENAYFAKKSDSVLSLTPESFFGIPDKIYKLDEFTRFPTMEDIFREYVYEVVVFKRKEKFELRLINSNKKNSRFLNTPLMLVDGIRVFDVEMLMNYNPLLIKEISLVTRSYIYAGILFDGVLSINTYDGNAKDLPIPSVSKEYVSWQNPKKYYSPIYNGTKNLDRVPDFRVQLFWNPIININPGEEFIEEFYTSDMEGDFLIEVHGFNSNGEVLNIRDIIDVRK